MIKSIHVTNYRALRDVACTLERFTVIVGPNGCGKSTLLEALERTAALRGVSRISCDWADDMPSPAGASMVVAGRNGGHELQRTWHINPAAQSKDRFLASWMLRTSNVDEEGARQMAMVPDVVAPVRFEQSRLRAPTDLHERIALPTPEGDGLPGVFADWKLEDDPKLGATLEQLQKVVPQVRAIIPRRTKRGFELFLMVGPSAHEVPAQHASTGTLYALGLLTLLQSLGGRSALVLIDDIDQDLHPVAQAELVAVLRKVLEVNPELQIVATSHSPYFLDHMKAEEVRLMTLDEQAFGHVAKLTDHPEYERWRGMMMPGEFWSSIGEKWILDPASASVGGG